ncbi:MAG: ATP-dependent 6-phosphofructokinase, partial [Verrucomicrobia bacterium]|nr:ATP-dependent 6-phosphofructokinase [Verrucomicrobiota bacterium]
GTQKNALHLVKAGLNIITLPKTIDNDVAGTDVSFGFDTAMNIVTEAIDRLHSTAMSHHRIIVVEVMGHRAGWLALGAGLAGGADVILIPEIPYTTQAVADMILKRTRAGKHFSIVAVAEGAMSRQQARQVRKLAKAKEGADSRQEKRRASTALQAFHGEHVNHTVHLTAALEKLTGQESRLTILGHLQRGGAPSAADRVLATRLGTACAELLSRRVHGVMVAAHGRGTEALPLEKVAGHKNLVTSDHPWTMSARQLGISLGE